MVVIREERAADSAAVRNIHLAAFPTPAESLLVEKLRTAGKAEISLVAEAANSIVGHILFSPVSAEGKWGRTHGLGLGPIAVDLPSQGQGVGSALIIRGLERAKERGFSFVVVLGDPKYYRRFGFERAANFGLRNEYGADEGFMAVLLKGADSLPGEALASYSPQFREAALP